MTPVHALTVTCSGIAKQIVSPVVLENPNTGAALHTHGIWDTGATNSAISRAAAQELGLIPVSKATVAGVHSTVDVNVYLLKITLNNDKITITERVTECSELAGGGVIGLLIGMNIISRGDFSISNFNGKTIMSFRAPSLQDIDFVKGIHASKPIVTGKMPGRNDICPCGSGKKYKHCCGR